MNTMYLRSSRVLGVIALIGLLAACGGRSVSEHGIEQKTGVFLVGSNLIGINVQTNDSNPIKIKRSELERVIGVWGTSRSEQQKLQRYFVATQPGRLGLKLSRSGNHLMSKDIYLSEGQRKEIHVGDTQ